MTHEFIHIPETKDLGFLKEQQEIIIMKLYNYYQKPSFCCNYNCKAL